MGNKGGKASFYKNSGIYYILPKMGLSLFSGVMQHQLHGNTPGIESGIGVHPRVARSVSIPGGIASVFASRRDIKMITAKIRKAPAIRAATAICAAMALALALAGCDNSTSPGGGGNGGTTTPTFTVTFDSAGGSPVASQTVPQGGVATEPADHPGAGLWYGNVPNFVEWRHEGTRWDFATDTVTGNITLTAHWDGPTVGFIAGVAANNLAEAVAHANANAGAFTLAISQDVAVSRYETLTSNTNLTIIGLGGQREISRTGNWAIFSVGYGGRPVSNVRLTLGNGITLTRAAPGDGVLVWIEGNNTFVMEDGSKITRNNCDGGAGIPRGAVYIRAGSTFYMEGGEITGNHASLGHANEVAGVLVRGTLNQTGGIIYGNTTIAANDHPNVRVDGGTRTVNGEPAGNS